MSRRRTLIGFVAGAVSATVVAGGVAFAAMPSTADGTTRMCVNKSTGAARVVDAQAGKKCTSSERTVTLRPGVGWKGTWSSGATYRPGDLVRTADGATYLARTSSLGKAPASNGSAWARIAASPLATVRGAGASIAVNSSSQSSRTPILTFWSLPAGSYKLDGRFTVSGATDVATRIACVISATPNLDDNSIADGQVLKIDLPASADPGIREVAPIMSVLDLPSGGDIQLQCYTASGTTGLAVKVRGVLTPVASGDGISTMRIG